MVLVFAAAILSQYALDVLAVGLDGRMLAIRLVWALGLALIALGVDEQSRFQMRLSSALQSGLASVFVLALIHLSGGTAGPYVEVYPFLPLLMALVFPQDSLAVSVSGVLCTLGIVGLLILEGAPASQWLLRAGITGALALMGAYGAHQFRKAQHAEGEARLERARREALEQLAISERRRAQSEKLATIGQLSAGVMHEINNPVAFISANVDFLEREALAESPLPREELAKAFAETRVGIARVQEIIADLKGFSRMDAEELTECVLADVVNDAARIASLRLKHVARLEVEVPEALPPVLAVRRRLAQVLLNLLVNAGDALEEHGQQGPRVRIIGRHEGTRVLLLVEDNGPGFPRHVLPRLFETFFTTKSLERGTGLGLALSREMVEQFGGTLVAENREEGGARLRLELPCHPGQAGGARPGRALHATG
jgi:signal transduction histidine kinase